MPPRSPHLRRLSILLILAACPLLASAQEIPPDNPRTVPKKVWAGAPLAAARRSAIDPRNFHRPLDAKRVRKWTRIASAGAIAEFELFLEPFTKQETVLLKKVESMTPPIVNRLHFQDLRSMLRHGGLASLQLEQRRAGRALKHTTPPAENALYGAYDCVFASVGPPNGSPRYGDVILRLKDSVRENGWATPYSGMHFLNTIHPQNRPQPKSQRAQFAVRFDDRLHFSQKIVTEEHWSRALAYQAILVLRNLDDSPASDKVRDRLRAMLREDDPYTFWKLFIPDRKENLPPAEAAARVPFGYLEAKFANVVPIEFVTAIEVPLAKLEEVRSWPEAKPYLDRIRAKAEGTP